jgi:hypothetical protein
LEVIRTTIAVIFGSSILKQHIHEKLIWQSLIWLTLLGWTTQLVNQSISRRFAPPSQRRNSEIEVPELM